MAVESGELFRLVGYVGRRNFSFVLLYQNYPIRKYTKHQQHFDTKTGKLIKVPHKHHWDAIKRDSEVFIPEDINPKDDINEQFLAFCRECNIELLGGYQAMTFL